MAGGGAFTKHPTHPGRVRHQFIAHAITHTIINQDRPEQKADHDARATRYDPARFYFAGAQCADAVNSGQYVVQGGSIAMRFGSPQQPESVVARLAPSNALTLGAVRYERR